QSRKARCLSWAFICRSAGLPDPARAARGRAWLDAPARAVPPRVDRGGRLGEAHRVSSVRERLGRLRKRLLVANLRSRSIRLVKATRSGAFDLARLAEANRKAHQRVLAAMGRVEAAHIDLVPARG